MASMRFVERDIAVVSLPLVAGVAVASLAGHTTTVAWLSSFFVAAAMAACVMSSGRSVIPTCFLCFFAGVFCYSSSAAFVAPVRMISENGFAHRAVERLVSLIEGIAFPGEDTGPIVTALLTGRRGGLSGEVKAAFRMSGASHILALSGLHLGVIYVILNKALSILGNSIPGRAVRSLVTVLFTGVYTLMTGCGPSTVRAFIFICLNEASRLCGGRKRSSVAVLCASLTIQLSLNPTLISSAAFQLSYLAMAGIILLFPRLDAIYPPSARFDPMRRIWTSAMLSVSCQLFTAPVAWYHFHSFPKYFLITNLIALPLSELIITSAVATVSLTALGICPAFMVRVTDAAVCLLEFCLEAISTI